MTNEWVNGTVKNTVSIFYKTNVYDQINKHKCVLTLGHHQHVT